MVARRQFPVRLVLVETDPAAAALQVAQLTAGGFSCTWTCVRTEADLCHALDEPVDAVLADDDGAGLDGAESLRIVRERDRDLPFIVVSGPIGDDRAVDLLRAGADDCLQKDRLGRLAPALDKALHLRRLRVEAARATSDAAAQRRLLQSVLDAMGEAVVVTDPRGVPQFVNPAARQMLGDRLLQESGDGTAGHGLFDPVTGAPLQRGDCPQWRAIKGLSTDGMEMLVKRPGVEPRVVSASGRPVIDVAGRVHGGVMTCRDVTDERAARESLRRSEERYRSLFWGDLIGHYVSTPDGRLLACNPAFAAMFGFASVEEALRSDAVDLYQTPQDRDRFIALLSERRTVDRYDCKSRRADGQPILTVENAVGQFDEQGRLVEIHGSCFEVTEQRELERQRLRLHAADAIGHLAAWVAHDVNDALTVILGHSQDLAGELDVPDRCRVKIAAVSEAARQAERVARQLLVAGHRHVMRKRRVDLNEMIRGIESRLRQLAGDSVTLVLDLGAEAIAVDVDPDGLELVVTNLVVRARDTTPRDGIVRIETAASSRHGSQAPADQLGLGLPFAVLSVSDTGMGLDEASRALASDSIFVSAEGGQPLDLGLKVAQGIVKQGGGEMSVEGAAGGGSVFRVFLPAAAGAEAHTEVPAREQVVEAPQGRETVLVAEDDPAVRRLIDTHLANAGYRVILAGDGAEATLVLARATPPVDLVVADIRMPHLDGVKLADHIARHHTGAKILFISGHPGGRKDAAGAGVRFLAKPFTMAAFLGAVREALDAS